MLFRVENIVRKGEIACYKQFLLFSQCFCTLYGTFFFFVYFKCILKCLQSVSIWTSLTILSSGNGLSVLPYVTPQKSNGCTEPRSQDLQVKTRTIHHCGTYDPRRHCAKRRKCWLLAFSTLFVELITMFIKF